MKRTIVTAFASVLCFCASAQVYTYMSEGFEESAWQVKSPASVVSSTGAWTTNKNAAVATDPCTGQACIELVNKVGIVSPELPAGAGSVVFNVRAASNRYVQTEVSTDGVTFTMKDSYKETSTTWTKHTVDIDDAAVRYVRLSTTSNKSLFFDNVVITRVDGTDGSGSVVVQKTPLPYFTQGFTDRATFPQSKEECTQEVDLGGWLYLNAYKDGGEQYIGDGSMYSLRVLKNGGYVCTPVVSQGVVELSFDEGRKGKKVQVYTSKDGGTTWTLLSEFATAAENVLKINDRDVNRVKIMTTGSGDVNVDNIRLTAFPAGTAATVATGSATATGNTRASVCGTVTDGGDRALLGAGVVWSVGSDPTVLAGTAVEAAGAVAGKEFTVSLLALPAASEIRYRAYCTTLAGVAYGAVQTFATGAPTAPEVGALSAAVDETATDERDVYVRLTCDIADTGGAALTGKGVAVATEPSAAEPQLTAVKGSTDDISVLVPLAPSTTYYIRAYADNAVGRSYGPELTFATPAIVIPEYAHKVYWCDPAGDDATADGTAEHPFYQLQRAADLVQAGDTIYMRAGTYHYTERVNLGAVGAKNSGNIALYGHGGRAVLDFAEQPKASASQGIRLTGSYWHFYKIDIENAGDNGLLIERNKDYNASNGYLACKDLTDQAHDNTIEFCGFYRNYDTGLQIKNLGASNYIINCDSYYNCDETMENADGFAVKISHGDGNYFYGCRAYRNSDDGWDMFYKDLAFPDDQTTTIDLSWAIKNGYTETGDGNENSDGNGFKMGSALGRNNVVINRGMAVENLHKGFDQNHNTGNMILNNCSGWAERLTTSKSHFTYRIYEPLAKDHEARLTNCVAIGDGIVDRNKSAYTPCQVEGATLTTCDLKCTPADFTNLAWEQLLGDRKANGSLPDVDFMHLKASRLIDAGTEVSPYAGESYRSMGISYEGSAPDLGAWETPAATAIASVSDGVGGAAVRCKVARTECGLAIVTVPGATATEVHTLTVSDTAGRTVARKTFSGAQTAVMLPAGIVQIAISK